MSPRFPLRRLRSIACVAGLAVALALSGCGSVGAKADGGAGGATGIGGATGTGGEAPPTDGGAGGAGGGPGDGSTDVVTPPPDGGAGGGAKWDVDKWDNAQWG